MLKYVRAFTCYSKEIAFIRPVSDISAGGKTNTAIALNNSSCFTPYASGNTTIWSWLRDTINANNTGGCSDWFIGSNVEQDELRTSGIVSWYNSYPLWSSVESATDYAYIWYYYGSSWRSDSKDVLGYVVAFRAF